MITELAILFVKDGEQDNFQLDFAKAGQFISSIKGYSGHSLQKCIEHSNKYVLLVNWETIEDHTVGFRQSAVYQQWKSLLHHYYDPFPVVEHYEMIISNQV